MSVRASISSAAVGFVAPCLPSLADRPPKGAGWIHEIKHDGFRMMVRRNGVGVRLFTRNGYDWTNRYPLIRQAAHALRATSFLLDGEAVNCNEDGFPDFNTRRQRKNDRTVFLYAFDLIELDGRDLRREPIELRKTALVKLLRKADHGIFLNEHVEDEAAIVFQHACQKTMTEPAEKALDPWKSTWTPRSPCAAGTCARHYVQPWSTTTSLSASLRWRER
jgi:bifunctional non-homologous end joining protein LigD